ncbi:hypothetical protein ACS8E3_01370 [Psychrobacter sp. 2Y5]|uniref:hypothetical protein n=2 Tax=Psychrobacter TaxID=497 RepID=UPI003F47D4A5
MMKTSLNILKLNISKITPAMLAVILGSTLVLSGCQSLKEFVGKRDNGSLDYQQSQKLKPLQLPADAQTAPFVPLYPTPNAGVNTLNLENEAGKQYQLPKPQRTVATTTVTE